MAWRIPSHLSTLPAPTSGSPGLDFHAALFPPPVLSTLTSPCHLLLARSACALKPWRPRADCTGWGRGRRRSRADGGNAGPLRLKHLKDSRAPTGLESHWGQPRALRPGCFLPLCLSVPAWPQAQRFQLSHVGNRLGWIQDPSLVFLARMEEIQEGAFQLLWVIPC